MKLLFSIVIPVYNRADLLRRAISSVLKQTYNNYEVIIVNDCSTENIYSEIQNLLTNKIRLIDLDKNVGGAEARNIAIREATGEYISFLDSDDFWEEEKLQILNEQITKNREYKIFFNESYILKKSVLIKSKIAGDLKNHKTLFEFMVLTDSLLQTSALTIESNLIKETLFTSNLKKHQDLDLYIKFKNKKNEIFFIHKALSTWDISHEKTSISRQDNLEVSINWLKTNKSKMDEKVFYLFILKYLYSRNTLDLFGKDFELIKEGIKRKKINLIVFIKYLIIKLARIYIKDKTN